MGNDNNTGINNRGGGGLLCRSMGENNTKPESSTQSISNDVLGGEKGRRLPEITAQQRGVRQLLGRDTELWMSGCTNKITTDLERSVADCTVQQQLAGPAHQTEPHQQ